MIGGRQVPTSIAASTPAHAHGRSGNCTRRWRRGAHAVFNGKILCAKARADRLRRSRANLRPFGQCAMSTPSRSSRSSPTTSVLARCGGRPRIDVPTTVLPKSRGLSESTARNWVASAFAARLDETHSREVARIAWSRGLSRATQGESDLNDPAAAPQRMRGADDTHPGRRKAARRFSDPRPEGQRQPLVDLDNAASSQMPARFRPPVQYNTKEHAKIHRVVHDLSSRRTSAYEARASDPALHQLQGSARGIYTRHGTTIVTSSCTLRGGRSSGRRRRIVGVQLEHHSNIVPWQLLFEEKGAKCA